MEIEETEHLQNPNYENSLLYTQWVTENDQRKLKAVKMENSGEEKNIRHSVGVE